jgi:two-component system, OmpR family, response regulator
VNAATPTNAGTGLRVLVADDDPSITDLLGIGLRFVGFRVDTASTGHEAIVMAQDLRPDVLVIDVMMPDYDGFEVCRRLRGAGVETPVVFLTARDAVADKVAGLRIGGDDYITKPFSLEEVVARIEAVARRTQGTARTAALLSCGDLTLDQDTHEVRRGDVPVELTATEFNVLRHLMANAGRVVAKEQIFEHVWGYELPEDSTVVETYISYIRKKLDARGEPLITTVRGVGYLMRPAAP